eukprot:4663907-Amphidinium_carterae.1
MTKLRQSLVATNAWSRGHVASWPGRIYQWHHCRKQLPRKSWSYWQIMLITWRTRQPRTRPHEPILI